MVRIKEEREISELHAHITVFISMVILCIFALFCVLVESARTAGARWYLKTAVDSALDSVFGQYHKQLWDTYRLLFVEYEDDEEMLQDLEDFLAPYLERSGWYPMELQAMEVDTWRTVTDDNGAYLEQEILDYMKYGVWKLDFEEKTVEELWDNAKEAEAVQTIGTLYRQHAKNALKLEKALEAISESQKRQEEKKQEGLRRLGDYDGPGFRRTAGELIQELSRMPGLVAEYERQADSLAVKLEESRQVFTRESEDCGSQAQSQLDAEILQYESYVDADGERRQEVTALSAHSREQIQLVQETIEEAREVEKTIEEWEEDDDEEEEGDGPDLEELWSPVRRHFSNLEIRPLSFSHGVKDKEMEGLLTQVEQLYQSGLLALVLPEGMSVSDGLLSSVEELPTKSEIMTSEARTISLPEHLLLDEYCGRFFRCFRTNAEGEKTEHMGVEGDGGLAYELEYLLVGEETDEGNLTGVVHRLLAVREGLNLIHIMSDSQKREQARTVAMAITGIAGISPLLLLTTFFVMSVWALGESLMDVKGLLAGKRVMLIKSASDWTLEIGRLPEMGREGVVETGGGERGFSYLTWLKLLLLREEIVTQEYRMMDMIQMNLCRKQNSFRMRRGVYEMGIKGTFCGKHVFFSLGFVENLTGSADHSYLMTVSGERVY